MYARYFLLRSFLCPNHFHVKLHQFRGMLKRAMSMLLPEQILVKRVIEILDIIELWEELANFCELLGVDVVKTPFE